MRKVNNCSINQAFEEIKLKVRENEKKRARKGIYEMPQRNEFHIAE